MKQVLCQKLEGNVCFVEARRLQTVEQMLKRVST